MPGEGRAGVLKLFELVVFPSFCRICSTLLEKTGERLVCRECWSRLRPQRSPCCICCGRFFEGAIESHVCSACVEALPAFTRHRSAGRYRGIAKELIILLKYQKLQLLGKGLGVFLFQSLEEETGLWWRADALVPVPLHPKRRKARGFNQAEILARELGRQCGLEVCRDVLKKNRDALPQTSLSGAERRANLREAFSVNQKRRVTGKTLILVDDVFTTGTTVEECARTLLRAGADEVRAVTLAQA